MMLFLVGRTSRELLQLLCSLPGIQEQLAFMLPSNFQEVSSQALIIRTIGWDYSMRSKFPGPPQAFARLLVWLLLRSM